MASAKTALATPEIKTISSVYVVVFVAAALNTSVLPVLPVYNDKFGLTPLESSSVVSMAMFSMVAIAVPAGLIADRSGRRRLTIAASALLAASAIGHAFAANLGALLLARAGSGAALAMIWSAGLAVLSDAGGAAAVGGSATVAGIGQLGGFLITGLFVDAFGLAVPFCVIAAAAVTGTLLVMRFLRDEPETYEHRGVRAALQSARRDRDVESALVLITLLGLTLGIMQLLIPLEFGHNGVTPSAIGGLLAAGSVVWIIASAISARLGERVSTSRAAGIGTLLLATLTFLPTLSGSTGVLALFLILRGIVVGSLTTIAYPLAETGAQRLSIARATVIGLMNMFWGTAAFLGPLAAGAITDSMGLRAAWGATTAVSFGVALWLLCREPHWRI